jgi:Flp pilus assembly protein TadG
MTDTGTDTMPQEAQRPVFRRRGNRERSSGQALAEFAIITPILCLILLIAIDFGRLFATYVGVTNAAREGAMFGATEPTCVSSTNCVDPGNITFRARAEVGGATSLTVSRTCSASCASAAGATGNTITVETSQSFVPLTPFITSITGDVITITATATAMIQ